MSEYRHSQKEKVVKVIMFVVAAVLILIGGVWFLQGIGVLLGSFMTGQTRWVVYGGLALVVGCGLLAFATRRKVAKPKS